jgi:uncharacterized SAM-binding protein YcdF (DUF218 family)
MSWFTTNLIATVLMPPLSLLLPFGLGILLFGRSQTAARILLIGSFSLLWISATPYFAEGGLRLLEAQTVPLGPKLRNADAIVILGGGTYFRAPEYGRRDTVSETTLARLRYGAKLHRETGKPVLVTGGRVMGNGVSEAKQMQSALEQDFLVPVSWTEDESNNTLENARNSFRILNKAGVRRIFLVTHAWHMPRSAEAFRRAGFEVVEAPMGFTTRDRTDLLSFLPRAKPVLDSAIFVHEVIGLLWYRVKLAISHN